MCENARLRADSNIVVCESAVGLHMLLTFTADKFSSATLAQYLLNEIKNTKLSPAHGSSEASFALWSC
jgi:hypothetical protein